MVWTYIKTTFWFSSVLHGRLHQLVNPLPRILCVLHLLNQSNGFQSTETIVDCSGRQICRAYEVLPGHPVPALKKHVEKFRRRRQRHERASGKRYPTQ